MSRIEGRFAALRAAGRKALIPFVTAGDPEPAASVPLLHALVEAGADLLELGVPFSDPMADGPVIQRASERALAHHVTLHGVLDMVAAFREQDTDTPVILMGYLNPIEAFGYAEFAEAAANRLIVEPSSKLLTSLPEAGLPPPFMYFTATRNIASWADIAAGSSFTPFA